VLLDEATTIFRQLCDREQPDRGDLRMLGLCLLARGDRAGMEYLTTGIETEQLAPELDDVLHQFDELRQAAAAWDHRVMIEEALDRLTAQIEERRSTLAEVRSPEHELEEILEGRERGDAARPAWAWLGAQAGLARLAVAGGRLDQASDTYRRLAETACFPEAGQQLEQILGQLALRGDEALQLRRAEEAIDQYQHALELPTTAKGPGRRLPAVHGGLSLAFIDLGDMRRAQQHAREAVSLLGDLGEPDPGEALGRLMADQIGTTAHFWDADSGYAALVDLTRSDDPLRAQLSAARRALLTYLERAYRLQEEPHEAQLPVVTPILMDLGPGLVPSDRGPDWSLFKHYLPDMREELRRRTGVTVPAVRVRQDDTLDQDGYAVLLDEAPAVGGSVQLGMRYCPADETLLARVGVSQADGVEAPDPRSGRPGRWLPPPHWDSVTSAGLELWSEPLQYAVHHLAAVLRDNLRQFLGLQEAETLLDEWAETEEQQRLLETIRADQRGRLHAARVLRELAEEGVPLVAGDEILDVLGHADLIGREVVDVVAEVRDRLGSATADGRAGGPGAVGHVTDDRRLP
jgi:tetratricopeptide (TPR) repeat protein